MRFNYLKTCLKTAVLLTAVLLLGAGLAVAQQQVNLTAAPTTVTLPDGSVVPMWGYFCGAVVTTNTAPAATCNVLNPGSLSTAGVQVSWSPVVITVATGQTLQINLTNSLLFTAGTGTNTVPTSLVIVGQLGAGLGTTATSTTSPDHTYAQGCVTWPIASIQPGQQCNATTAGGPPGTPGSTAVATPTQGNRVQSFSTEVAEGATTSLTWTTPRPGTYLLESGTHPSIQAPMGLIGMVVVTEAPSATAVAPASPTQGCAYTPVAGTTCVVPYNAEADLLFSEIDPVQNNAVQTAVTTAGFSETRVWSGQPGGCGNPASPVGVVNTCYPPAVNYTPLYYLINGVGFSKSNAPASVFPVAPATVTGNVLVRLVNAGLRMHVPSIVASQTGASNVSGFSLIAEDGNPLPGLPRVQSEVFMAAGKTYDVMVNAPAPLAAGPTCTPVAPATTCPPPSLPVYDRELSLSGNATARDAGMIAYIGVNGSGLPAANGTGVFAGAVARADTYNSLVAGQTLTVSDPGKGVIANDTNVYGVQLDAANSAANGTVTLNANGTFTYVPSGTATSDSFGYCANGTTATSTPSVCTTVTLGKLASAGGISCSPSAFSSNVATYLTIRTPGVLAYCKDSAGYPLTVDTSTAPTLSPSGSVVMDASGGFTASVSAAGTYTFSFTAKNSAGATPVTGSVTLTFPAASNLAVTVLDGADKTTQVPDYRWIIEEDRTFYIDPNCTTNPPATGCPTAASGIVPTFGTNFHTSYMPVVASGCTGPLSCEGGQKIYDPTTGTHIAAVCDVGNGVCRPDLTGNGFTVVLPGSVHLDPTKRYFISILPGDAANPFAAAYGGAPDCSAAGVAAGSCGHGMGGAPIGPGQLAVTILTQPTPLPPAQLSVFVFEDDFPLNGEQDAGGGVDILATNEPGLGGFEITLFDDAGGTGDATGQLTHDMFNQPLSNSLAGTIDPTSGLDACPIVTTNNPLAGMDTANGNAPNGPNSVGTIGITGRIVTCPKYEADGATLSPLAGQAVVPNMMQGRYGVVATPAADRIAQGEEWLQTNTLDGQKAHDSFLRIGEPSYFQEFGPAGYHVSIGFANPKIINDRLAAVCGNTDPNLPPPPNQTYVCNNSITGSVSTERMSRTPDERLYSSGSYDSFAFTQCFVSIGDPDGEDFAFTKCDGNGNFRLTGLPQGVWRVTVFDQWNDMLVDGLSTPVNLTGGTAVNMGAIAMNQWQANIYTSTFFDANRNGVRDSNEAGLTLVSTNIRFRDGSFSNFNNTDLSGNAGFNEIFPLFSWYVVETDSTRYKSTGTHVVYDAGGPADGTCATTTPPSCGSSTIAGNMANTAEVIPVPAILRVPGAFYCSTGDCTDAPSPLAPGGSGGSTGRVDPPWVVSEGWQGFSGQNSFLEFGKRPFVVGENGGIHGEVVYDSTRPFDDPQLNLHLSWTPNVPNVTVNLYQEGVAADNVTPTLKLVDTTKTSSWDDWAQGFRSDAVPNMNCPGQGRDTGTNADLFFFSLFNQPNYLDFYNNVLHGTSTTTTALPLNSQFKCYDGMHNWNQLQPAPYDGAYRFPSVTGINPTTGMPTGTNCTVCVPNPDSNDPWRSGTPMLPAGTYVVEVVVPPGYELLKEEDKNILIGDNYIAPVTQEFGGLGSIYIMPDQAAVASSYNANNAQNQTTDLGTLNLPRGEGDTGSVEQFWRCVGEARIVPDFMSIFPQAQEVAAFAGATRNLCDRREVVVSDQASSLAKFYIFSSTHVAAHFTGVITDDYTSEFDPFSPQFGEKFSPANQPVSIKDWAGNEISRVYSDHWGTYDGLTYSTWEVNPPNPTGYGPNTMVTCMNDKGPILDTRQMIVNSSGTSVANPTLGQMITDPLFNPQYSQFCYEIPFMPGQTQYMDTPVVPTSAFAGAGYNNPDCDYPTLTPAIAEVDGDGVGPWVSATGRTITITALGDQIVDNYGYSGPSATAAPFNQKTVTRHYGFGTCTPTATSVCNAALVSQPGQNPAVGGTATVRLNITSWSDTTIVATVPNSVGANPHFPCLIQQQAQYGGSSARCGQLVITAGNGRQSVDAVTVTVGGKAPTHVAASASIQAAIDAAAPGDLIIVDPTCTTTTTGGVTSQVACTTAGASKSPTTHKELLLMWKPVRLQGVGAASSIIDANTHPAGTLKLDPWRRSINCLFGLALSGQPVVPVGNQVFDSTGTYTCPTQLSGGTGPNGNTWNYFSGGPNFPTMAVDRIPREGILGWDATLNGNLAEQLQEPSIMGAYEGAGITVLSKGVNIPAGSTDVFGSGTEADFPTGSTLLITATKNSTSNASFPLGDANSVCHTSSTNTTNPFPSNYMCNPSSIDGLGITDASQGGGGIFVHAWGHNLQIANNRIYNNTGTLSGGISLGQGESPEAYLAPNSGTIDPGSCIDSTITNRQLPFCLQINANIHNNYITDNSSTGDELFSGTPAGAGGVSLCTGSDYYKFNYNWVCGNMSTGDGGGVGHLGFSYNGDIEHNSFLFNQSINPTIQSNGGGLIVMGSAPDASITVGGVATECGSVTDNDCVPGLSDGTGPGLLINANLFEGNSADAGSGGGLRLQAVNGTEVSGFPSQPDLWYHVLVSNNIINNNVAGWDGAGISLEDALAVTIINNTISSNDTTASSGVLFNTLGAPLASSQSPAPACLSQSGGTVSCPQPAGLVSMQNSPQMTSSFTTGAITCPAGNFTGTATNGTCTHISYPVLYNNIFWQNRAFQIGVGSLGTGTQNQQNVVTLYNAAVGGTTGTIGTIGTVAASQASTGACPTGSSYWDIGVRGDRGPGNHGSTFTLNPQYSVLTSTSGYSGTNTSSNPLFGTGTSGFGTATGGQYCNGSRVPPENGGLGYQVPPGIADATVPNPIFTLGVSATVDEGNNWINMSWGPLSMLNPFTSTGTTNVVLGNYALQTSSPAINYVPTSEALPAGVTIPTTDFFGNTRPDSGQRCFDVGAVETQGSGAPNCPAPPTVTSINPTSGAIGGTGIPVTITGTNLTGATAITISGTGVTHGAFTVNAAGTTITTTFSITRGAALGARNVTVTTPAGGSNPVTFTVTAAVLSESAAGLLTGATTTHTGTVTVSNATGATSGPLTITSVGVAKVGSAGGTFSVAAGGTCVAGFVLNPGSSCTVSVTYAPGAAGTTTATAHINLGNSSGATGTPVSVTPNFTAN